VFATERLMRTPPIIPAEEFGKAALLFDALAAGADRPFVLHGHHKRSTKMLSWQRPRPSMLISTRDPAASA